MNNLKLFISNFCLLFVILSFVVGCSSKSGDLTATPSSIDFGEVLTGTSVSQEITLINNGKSTIEITDFEFSNSNEYSVNETTPFEIAKDKEYKIKVNFMPTAVGTRQCVLLIKHDGSGDAVKVQLKGEGKPSALIELSTQSIDFGTKYLFSSTNHNFEIRSTGTLYLEINDIKITGTDSSAFSLLVGGTVPFNLSPGASHQVQVTFSPQIIGSFNAKIEIHHSAINENSPMIINLTGKGVLTAPEIYLPVTSYDYGIVAMGDTINVDFEIHNIGTDTLTLANFNFVGDIIADYSITTGGNAPIFIAPGQKHIITVCFKPTTKGVFDTVLQIMHDAINEPPPATISLHVGKVIDTAWIVFSRPSNWDFGTVPSSSSTTQVCEIENIGSKTLTITEFTMFAGDAFTIVSVKDSNGNILNTPFQIGPGEKVFLTIKFNPSATTPYNDKVEIIHDAPNEPSPYDIGLIGSGS